MGEDGRNGSRPSIRPLDDDFGEIEKSDDPAIAAALAAKALRRQALADDDIADLEVLVARIVKGDTEWQHHQKEALRVIHDEVTAINFEVTFIRRLLVVEKFVRPSLFYSGLILTGVAIGTVIFSFVRG